ncbi:MAG: enoyl-CoA hydratase/isomerase family protein [Hyphomicrobiales bacterium]|nr:enoyl-CoA hydratase/isomerase family protein [Hyphomicrobiales bacterium]
MTQAAADSVLVARDGPIATVTLNNPARRNALTKGAWRRLAEVMEELDAEDDLRCVVVRGAGDEAFAAGADISEFETERANAAQATAYAEVVRRAVKALREIRHITIAMVQGACTGGGLEIACCLDLRLGGHSARLGVPINRLGNVLAYPELDVVLRLAGEPVVLEMLLEGRIFNAEESHARGLLNRIYPDAELAAETQAAARRIADGAPLAARQHKYMLRRLRDPAPITEAEMAACRAVCDSDDYREGFRAFLAKEKPRFTGR